MRIVHAQVFDPIFHPGGTEHPPRIEMLVEDLDLDTPTQVIAEGKWTVAWYDEFCLFWHEFDQGERTIIDDDGDEVTTFHEGYLNASGVLGEPVFPVTVAIRDAAGTWRDLFAPASTVIDWLEKLDGRPEIGKWTLRASTAWALRGQIVFELHFIPARAVEHQTGARARAARKPRT